MKSEKIANIKKALECSAGKFYPEPIDCKRCGYARKKIYSNCNGIDLAEDCLIYINELENENKRLQNDCTDIAKDYQEMAKFYDEKCEECDRLTVENKRLFYRNCNLILENQNIKEQAEVEKLYSNQEVVEKIITCLADYKEYEYESISYKDWCVPHMVIKHIAKYFDIDISKLNDKPSKKVLSFNGVEIKE